MKIRITFEEFVKRAKEKFGDLYDYSLVNWRGVNPKVEIICKVHGSFWKKPTEHMRGQGCNIGCFKEQNKNNFLTRVKEIHGNKYDYSEINYINKDTKLRIRCVEHNNWFEQTPRNHLYPKNEGCDFCRGEIYKTTEGFVKHAKLKHNNKYDYSKVNYTNSSNKVIIICPEHGEFSQNTSFHLSGGGCPHCKSSRGENHIKYVLKTLNIVNIQQHTFSDCKNKNPLPFDFYLPDHNLCIEYQGEQHFKPIKRFGGLLGFNKVKLTDSIKKEYCKSKNVILIEYTYLDTFETITNDLEFMFSIPKGIAI